MVLPPDAPFSLDRPSFAEQRRLYKEALKGPEGVVCAEATGTSTSEASIASALREVKTLLEARPGHASKMPAIQLQTSISTADCERAVPEVATGATERHPQHFQEGGGRQSVGGVANSLAGRISRSPRLIPDKARGGSRKDETQGELSSSSTARAMELSVQLSTTLEWITVRDIVDLRAAGACPQAQSLVLAGLCLLACTDVTEDGPQVWADTQSLLSRPGHVMRLLKQFPTAVQRGMVVPAAAHEAEVALAALTPIGRSMLVEKLPAVLLFCEWMSAALAYYRSHTSSEVTHHSHFEGLMTTITLGDCASPPSTPSPVFGTVKVVSSEMAGRSSAGGGGSANFRSGTNTPVIRPRTASPKALVSRESNTTMATQSRNRRVGPQTASSKADCGRRYYNVSASLSGSHVSPSSQPCLRAGLDRALPMGAMPKSLTISPVLRGRAEGTGRTTSEASCTASVAVPSQVKAKLQDRSRPMYRMTHPRGCSTTGGTENAAPENIPRQSLSATPALASSKSRTLNWGTAMKNTVDIDETQWTQCEVLVPVLSITTI